MFMYVRRVSDLSSIMIYCYRHFHPWRDQPVGLLEARHPRRYAFSNREGLYVDFRCLLLVVRSSDFNAGKQSG